MKKKKKNKNNNYNNSTEEIEPFNHDSNTSCSSDVEQWDRNLKISNSDPTAAKLSDSFSANISLK